jgi:glutamine amidotransferase
MKSQVIGIVNYGVGNLASVRGTLKRIGYRTRVSDNPDDFEAVDLILLPGVGAFPAAREVLSRRNLDELIIDRANKGTPILGICLGMQLLADSSTEVSLTAGLGLVPGSVCQIEGLKSHTGWNQIQTEHTTSHLGDLLNVSVYFNHSFEFRTRPEFVISHAKISTDQVICAAIQKDNLVGIQFHPEKSQQNGRHLLENILESMINA